MIIILLILIILLISYKNLNFINHNYNISTLFNFDFNNFKNNLLKLIMNNSKEVKKDHSVI